MAKLIENPTLKDYQSFVKEVCSERGWDKNDPLEIFLLLSEEMGELAKAIRYKKNIFSEEGKKLKDDNLEDEFADVLSYLFDLANQFDIDLEAAFRNKEAKNTKRVWISQK